MTLFDVVEKLNTKVKSDLERLWERHEDGDITFEEYTGLASAVIAKAAQQARAIGDLSVAAQLTKLNQQIEVASGETVDDDLPSEAAAAIQEQTDTQSFDHDPGPAMGVAGAAVVMGAMQAAIQRSMQANKVEYFTRTANPGACEICEEMAGVTLPAHVEMWHHKGCMCVPTIIIHTK